MAGDRSIDGPEPYAVSDFALMGIIRVVTNPRIYRQPATLEVALGFADQFRNQPHAHVISPGPSFWAHLRGPMRAGQCSWQPDTGCLPGGSRDRARLRVRHGGH